MALMRSVASRLGRNQRIVTVMRRLRTHTRSQCLILRSLTSSFCARDETCFETSSSFVKRAQALRVEGNAKDVCWMSFMCTPEPLTSRPSRAASVDRRARHSRS